MHLCQVGALHRVQMAPFTVCLSSPHISQESPHISSDRYTHCAFTYISLHTWLSSWKWSTNGEKNVECLLLHEYFDEEVSGSWGKFMLYYVYMGGHFDQQHYSHNAGADNTTMTCLCIFVWIRLCVFDVLAVYLYGCGGHLVLKAVCFR